MNKTRRAELNRLQDRIEELKSKLDFSALTEELEEIKNGVESARDEEQEYYDNMPESLQSSDKGLDAEQAIGAMDEAMGGLEELIATLDALDVEPLDRAFNSIEEAKGNA